MLFNSYGFVLALLPIFVIAYSVLRHIFRKKEEGELILKLCLIGFSAVFFLFFGLDDFGLFAISIALNVLFANLIVKFRDKDFRGIDGRIIMLMAVSVNIFALVYFKYLLGYFPVAISFYTFNMISFLVDLYTMEIPKFKVIDYLVYVLYFPKVIQGPLQRYADLSKELEKSIRSKFSYDTLMRGLYLFSIGLFKKVLLADTFGEAVSYGFENVTTLGSLEAILVSVFYTFQLYFDFSGYCDMASAISMMIGIELPVNFNSPYKATNIVDFWKRWHITLTGFFTKYLYIPLGGNRRGKFRKYLNYLVVFLISGVWHGRGYTFLVWGLLHGVLFVITRMWMDRNKTSLVKRTGSNPVKTVVSTILTFAYVNLAWVFFRAPSLKDAVTLIGRMFVGGKKALPSGLTSVFRLDEFWYVIKVTPLMKTSFVWDLCMWLFLIVSAYIIFFRKNALEQIKSVKLSIWTTLVTALFLVWSILSFSGVGTFLYMNF